MSRAGDGDIAVAQKFQRRPEKLALQSGGVAVVADEQVGKAERPHVDRAGRREALLPIADAARKILDGGFQPRDVTSNIGSPEMEAIPASQAR